MTTRETIETYYPSVNRGDWETWLTLFPEDVVIDEQLAGHVEGLDILRGAIGGMEKGYSSFQNVPKHIVVQGDERRGRLAHLRRERGRRADRGGGRELLPLRDGKIAYMANFHDTRPFDPFVNQKLNGAGVRTATAARATTTSSSSAPARRARASRRG